MNKWTHSDETAGTIRRERDVVLRAALESIQALTAAGRPASGETAHSVVCRVRDIAGAALETANEVDNEQVDR